MTRLHPPSQLLKAKKHLSKDPILKGVISMYPIPEFPKSQTVFQELVKSIAYQQISYKAADSIFARFLILMGNENFLPEDLVHFSEEEVRSVGFSRPKTKYIFNIAQYFIDNEVDEEVWEALSNDEIIELLTTIKGVGEWTVQMILMFQLLRPDVFPSKDLGIQNAMINLYKLKTEKRQLINDMEKIAKKWKPYRSFASKYLWAWKREN